MNMKTIIIICYHNARKFYLNCYIQLNMHILQNFHTLVEARSFISLAIRVY